MGTYYATWQCSKCRATVNTVKRGISHGWGDVGESQLVKRPCPCGGDHDWHKLTYVWDWDDKEG